jgi:hypothetical protein
MVSIDVINVGHRALVVSAPQFMVGSDKKHVVAMLDTDGLANFPARLADGESAAIRVEYREIAGALMNSGRRGHVDLLAVCNDSTGRRYRSKPWKIDLAEWLG